ncbi:MAG: hypothetical protein U0794_19390 [Isosphaeraceae bacterium]
MRRPQIWMLGALILAGAGSTGLRSHGARLVGVLSGGRPRSEATLWSHVEPGWRLDSVWTFPERVNALMAPPPSAPIELRSQIYVGTAGTGSVHRINPGSIGAGFSISRGLGDAISFGESNVNRLALHDLDGDGELELIGSTSQIFPRGRPRLHVWNSTIAAAAQRAVARPEIASSWSHSLGFLSRPETPAQSVFVTFCGFGEIVEYRLNPQAASHDGFRHEELSWKKVGQLPASGEWLEVGDVDNDHAQELLVATGYALKGAAIHVYQSPAAGSPLQLKRVIDEDRRFGNVRFKLIPSASNQESRLVAWWCTDLAGGDAEMIVYRLGPEGVRERQVVQTGTASELWPDDGRFDLGDVDGDGHDELWFATSQGVLWRFEPERATESAPAPRRIATFREPITSLTLSLPVATYRRARVYIGCGHSVVSLEASPPGA